MRFALPSILNVSLARNLHRLLPSRRSRGGPRVGSLAAVALLAACSLLAVVPQARAQDTLTALYSFSATIINSANTDGDGPSNLIMGSDGNFYGTTVYGGSAGVGTIFRLTPGGGLTTLYTFTGGSDDGYPLGPLYRTDDGSLYGTTTGLGGTNGTIFQLTAAGTLNTLYAFTGGSDGANPFAALVANPDGYLYSTTASGGTNNSGVIFRIAPSGAGFQVLYAFTGGNDGGSPQATMLLASDGNFYGENLSGGADGFGTIYQFNPTTNALNTLYTFTSGNSNDGSGAVGALVEGPGNVLYGQAGRGGDANNDGYVFSITTGGAYSLLYSFTGGADGSQPFSGLIVGSDGNLYGTTEKGGTNNDGVIFKLPTSGGTPTTLYTFSAESNTVNTEGYNPNGNLIQVGSNFYGLAFRGGSGGSGTFFELTTSPAFFTGETALSNGVYYLAFSNGNYFGYYSFLANPAYLYHFDLGYEYVFDAADGKSGVYFYDFASSDFFYTSPSFPFPYLYDFSLNSVLYYYPDPNNPGHYNTNGIRYFYDFNTGTIITK